MFQGIKGGMDSVAIANPSFAGGSTASNNSAGQQADAKEAATDPKLGDIYNQIQAKYGAKPEKPREIKKTLGKDDFLKIMITQMKNQDPTNPFKAEQMATEVAQFTSVEQLQNVNQNLNKMVTNNKPFEQMAMTNLIGKVVTIDRQRFPHTEGQNDPLSFNLIKDAASVKVSILSDTGEEIFHKEMGSQKAGEVSLNWDGIRTNSLPAKSGNYLLRVEAKDKRGLSIATNPKGQARVIGISFEGLEPVFVVGDARHQEKITMKNIVRIDMDAGSASLPQGTHPQGISPKGTNSIIPAQDNKPNYFSFQKGVGSSAFKPGTEPVLPAMKPDEKGFPNGLSDPEQSTISMKGGDKK